MGEAVVAPARKGMPALQDRAPAWPRRPSQLGPRRSGMGPRLVARACIETVQLLRFDTVGSPGYVTRLGPA